MPSQEDPIYNPNELMFGDPVLSTASVKPLSYTMAPTKPASPIKPMVTAGAISKIGSDAQSNRSLQTFLQTGVVDKTMIEGFSEMGASVPLTEWLSIQKRWGLTNAQLNGLKAAHANYFGLALASPAPGGPGSSPDGAPLPMMEPRKKPNYLLWAAIAVGGFFIVRRFLK